MSLRRWALRALSGRRTPHRGWVILLGIAASAGVLAWLVSGHLGELLGVGSRVDWYWVLAAVAASLGSYLMVALALEEVLFFLGYRLAFAEVLGIALVSTTANYFISAAGLSGFALKAHLLRKRRVPYGITVTASVLSSAILYMVLAVIIAQGLAYLLLRLGGTRIAVMESALGLLVLLAVAVPMLVFFFHHELRGRLTRKLFHGLNRIVYVFSKSEIPREDFVAFEEQLKEGLEKVRGNTRGLTATVVYTCLDWSLCMAALYYAFRAVGLELSVGHLSAGFTVGQAATLIPVLPGGLGVMEGSIAAVLESLGVDWDRALVATLIYRLAFYAVPGAISVFVLWGLKVSEPALIEETVREILPEELKEKARELERRREDGRGPREAGW